MELEPGEVVCDQCKGTGYPNNNEIDYNNKFYYNHLDVCDKCNGSGKLDWIENIVGKKSRTFNGDWTIIGEQLYGSNLEKDIFDQTSKNMAKEILEGIINGSKSGSWGSDM